MTSLADPVITPFVQAVRAAGWMLVTAGRCALLERCERCQNPYLFTFLLDRAQLKACPFCAFSQCSPTPTPPSPGAAKQIGGA